MEFEEEVEEEGWTDRERAEGMKTFTLSVSTSQRSRTCAGEEEDDDDAWGNECRQVDVRDDTRGH